SFAAYAGDVRTLEIARPADKIVNDSLRGPIGFLGQVVQRTFYGNGVDEILAVDLITWNGTTPTTSTFWTFTDHQDSVRDIVSGNAADRGQVVEHRQYDSFGKVVRRTIGPQAGATTTAGVGVEVAFAGRPFESRTGLSDNRARWYEPATGRFVNEDPSGFKGGDANLFRYVGNDPVNQVDPSGLAAIRTSGAKTSVPTAGWAALGQGAMLPTSGSRLSSGSATPVALPPAVARSPYQSVYRTEVERIETPSAIAGNAMRLSMPSDTFHAPSKQGELWADNKTPYERYRSELHSIARYGKSPQERAAAIDELYFGPPPAGVTGVDLWHAARDIAAATRGAMSPQAGRFARPGGLPR
ncbi:MAG: RHS repeat-associated core domain-containing protein, partial [Planctomycetia bacterium]